MSSLADLSEVIGFFSYSREDDEAFKGTLSALRDAIQRELGARLGRSKKSFRLWQDQEAIALGKLWESEIKTAIEQSVFFIPIITPRSVNSKYCKFEFDAFIARECALGRSDLIFPILYIAVPALDNDVEWRNNPVLSAIASRQYVDWRPFRHLDIHSTPMCEATERFCSNIVDAVNRTWLSPGDRNQQEKAEVPQRVEAEPHRHEVASKLRTDQETAEAIQPRVEKVGSGLLADRSQMEVKVQPSFKEERNYRSYKIEKPDVSLKHEWRPRRAFVLGGAAIGACGLVASAVMVFLTRHLTNDKRLELGAAYTNHLLEVRDAKRILQHLGYYTGPITNDPDDAYFQAVANFQHDKNITQDGLVGGETYGKFREAWPEYFGNKPASP